MTYAFSLRKRWKVLAPVLWVEAGLLALLVWRGSWSWRTGVVLTVVALLALRVATYLWGARRPVVLEGGILTRGDQSVPLAGAQVEVRALPRKDQLRPNEVIVRADGRVVSFDVSLNHFDDALGELLSQASADAVRVSAPGEPDVRDARKSELLAASRRS
jgi:hypothetical protein